MSQKTITINGKLYDADTGLPIKAPATKPAPAKKAKRITVSSSKKIAVREVNKAAPRTKAAAVNRIHKTATPINRPKKISPHKPAKPQTLNRKLVKKPAETNTKTIGASKKTAANVKPTVRSIAPRIAVKPSPIIPQKNTRTQRVVQPATTVPVKTSDQPPHTPKKHIKATLITLAAMLVLIGGAVAAYLFIPNVSFLVASTRANVSAKLPTYTAEGYHVNGVVESSPGQVTVNYISNINDDAAYVLLEQNSNWDSKGVLENKVKPISRDYQTLTQKGLTIYRFNGKATWVNGGILYTITDNDNLSNDQILQIVDSI